MSSRSEISIALCTYNGEKYLKDQLDSFAKQTLSPCELVVCDDCSSDSTLQILEEFSRKVSFPVRIFRNEHNLGLIKNFSKAAGLCRGEYIAFSDQDDIWLPDKLEVCLATIKKAELEYGENIPLLVHTDLRLIDTNNNVVSPSWMKIRHIQPPDSKPLNRLLAQNYISGCASLCNSILIKKSLPFPDVITNHDGWCALIAACCGMIWFIPEATVLYRQHSYNYTGKIGYLNLINTVKAIIRALIKGRLSPRFSVALLAGILNQVKILDKHLNGINCEVPTVLCNYFKALQEGGLSNAYRIIFSYKVRQFGIFQNVLDFYIISRKLYLDYDWKQFWEKRS